MIELQLTYYPAPENGFNKGFYFVTVKDRKKVAGAWATIKAAMSWYKKFVSGGWVTLKNEVRYYVNGLRGDD